MLKTLSLFNRAPHAMVKTGIYTLTLLLLSTPVLLAQGMDPLPLHKPVGDNVKMMNAISLELAETGVKQLHAEKGQKMSLRISRITINDDTLKVDHMHVRGNTSSYFRRKSFNIKTKKPGTFHYTPGDLSLSKFYAISMNMDRNYVRNKISYAVTKLIGVHTPPNCYANLLINGSSEGLYLVFYPPDEYALKHWHAPIVIRRGYGEAVDKFYTAKGVDRQEAKELKKKFRTLYAPSTLNKSGEELYQQISAVLDLDSYMSWLAYNDLFRNGDYSDEVYLMWNTNKSRFEILPWDFDDLLKDQPHEGKAEREKSTGGDLVFSLEDKLDKRIAEDPYLYRQYLIVYQRLVQTLTPEQLRRVLTEVFDEVAPYYMHGDIVAQSQYDQYGSTDLDKLVADLNSIYQYISIRVMERQRDFDASKK